MPEIKIKIPEAIHKKLKQKAQEEMRSLTNYLTYHIGDLVNENIINLTNVPEGTTIKTKTQKPLTQEEIEEQKKQSFLSLCKEMYGEAFYEKYKPDIIREYLSLLPDNIYYNFAEEIPDKLVRAVYTMPIEKQKEYIIEMKHYLEE